MLRVVDRQQGFFDAAWCSSLLPEESIYALLAEHGQRIVRDEDFAECYSERQGRPSIPPSLLAKMLLLAYRDGLSDERAMEAVRFDLPSLSTSGETLTIEESVTLRARTEKAGHGDAHEWSWSSGWGCCRRPRRPARRSQAGIRGRRARGAGGGA